MAAPAIVALPANTWAKVATNVTGGIIIVQSPATLSYIQKTYVATGSAAPTNMTAAVPVRSYETTINVAAAIDVYYYSSVAGSVLVAI